MPEHRRFNSSDWQLHLNRCRPAVQSASNALQIALQLKRPVPFKGPTLYPLQSTFQELRGEKLRQQARQERMKAMASAPLKDNISDEDLKTGRPTPKIVIHGIDQVTNGLKNAGVVKPSLSAPVQGKLDEPIDRGYLKPRPLSDNIEVAKRRDTLRKQASVRAASHAENPDDVDLQRKLDHARITTESQMPVLNSPLTIRSAPEQQHTPTRMSENRQDSRPFPWKVPGVGRTFLLWQEYYLSLALKRYKFSAFKRLHTQNLFLINIRERPEKILFCVRGATSTSIQTTVTCVRIPRVDPTTTNHRGRTFRNAISDTWIFICMVDRKSLPRKSNGLVSTMAFLDSNMASWTVMAFPSEAITRQSQHSTEDGQNILRWELRRSGYWPLVDGQRVNMSIWYPWIDAVAMGSGCIEIVT